MSTSQEIASTVLNLTDHDFFLQDPSRVGKLDSKLLRTDFIGVAVNAPKEIRTGQQSKLPLVMGIRAASVRDWDVPIKKNCVLFASDLNTGDVRVCQANRKRPSTSRAKPRAEATPSRPSEEELEGTDAGVRFFDVVSLLEVPWKSGKYALGMISYDWVSNVVEVELKGESEAEIGAVKEVFPPPNPLPQKKGLLKRAKPDLPYYEEVWKTPEAPAQGANFVVVASVGEAGQKIDVYGTFVTKAKKHFILEWPVVHRSVDGRELTAFAVVPMTLLILGLDWAVPRKYDWAVPVYGSGKTEAGAPLRGYFAIDAIKEQADALPSGKYVAYVILDSGISGPRTFEV